MIYLDADSKRVITGWCEDISKNKQWESVYIPKKATDYDLPADESLDAHKVGE